MSARPGLCGGHRVTGVPTAIASCAAKLRDKGRQRGVRMIVPLVGLFVACAIFACIGAALLPLVPHLRPTLANVALFVAGAVPICAVTAVAYGRVFGDAMGELRPPAVLGLLWRSRWSLGCAEDCWQLLRTDGSCERCVCTETLAAQSTDS